MISDYTVKDINDAMVYVEDSSIPNAYVDIILDALEFYKEMNYQ